MASNPPKQKDFNPLAGTSSGSSPTTTNNHARPTNPIDLRNRIYAINPHKSQDSLTFKPPIGPSEQRRSPSLDNSALIRVRTSKPFFFAFFFLFFTVLTVLLSFSLLYPQQKPRTPPGGQLEPLVLQIYFPFFFLFVAQLTLLLHPRV
jgi:hypothetical protein